MDSTNHDDFDLEQVRFRQARATDMPALRELFVAGMLEGQVPDNDTGADIDNLLEAYFSDDGESCFWVAEYGGAVVGMVGVQKVGSDTSEIRRLRVRADLRRRGIGMRLMHEAVSFCQRLGYLKVVLDVRFERGPAIALFEKFGFKLARTRDMAGRKMLDFYLDLYREPNV
jgi:ribosomal protein S18 acetylase RimI-like enzyme